MYSLADNLNCFVCDLERMPFTELLGWSKYHRQKSEAQQAEPELDWSKPETVANVFKL